MLLFSVGGETVSSVRESGILAGRNFRSRSIESTDPENRTEVALSLHKSVFCNSQSNRGSFHPSWICLQNHHATSRIWLLSVAILNYLQVRGNKSPVK